MVFSYPQLDGVLDRRLNARVVGSILQPLAEIQLNVHSYIYSMDIQVFIFNYAHFYQAMTLFKAFEELGYDTYILNCESPKDPPFEATDKIRKLPNIYYSGQWNESLGIANKDVMFLINSDVRVRSPAKLMARMRRHYEGHPEQSAVYAPNFCWTPWTYDPGLLPHLGDNVRIVPACDSTVWALKMSLAHKVGEVPLAINRLGWGIEIVASYYASLEGKLTVRDYGIKLHHPQSTAYDRGVADNQFRRWIGALGIEKGFWEYYDTRYQYGFGWAGDDDPPPRKRGEIPLA